MRYDSPRELKDALSLLATDTWVILSGGTDFYPSLGDDAPCGNVLDISKIEGLRGIREEDDHWCIGALVTWSDLVKADLPPAFNALKLAAVEIGSIQIQNRATLVGNVCNASPAADGMPPLLILDAMVRISSLSGTRDVPLTEFVMGSRVTLLQADEIVSALVIPKKAAQGRSNFIKLGARKYLVISITMVSTRLNVDDRNRIVDAAIGVGACSVVARRLPELESALIGRDMSQDLVDVVDAGHFDDLSPIDDIRATRTYRLDASVALVRRSLMALIEQGG